MGVIVLWMDRAEMTSAAAATPREPRLTRLPREPHVIWQVAAKPRAPDDAAKPATCHPEIDGLRHASVHPTAPPTMAETQATGGPKYAAAITGQALQLIYTA